MASGCAGPSGAEAVLLYTCISGGEMLVWCLIQNMAGGGDFKAIKVQLVKYKVSVYLSPSVVPLPSTLRDCKHLDTEQKDLTLMVRFTGKGWSWETCFKLKHLKLGFMAENSDENSLKSYN